MKIEFEIDVGGQVPVVRSGDRLLGDHATKGWPSVIECVDAALMSIAEFDNYRTPEGLDVERVAQAIQDGTISIRILGDDARAGAAALHLALGHGAREVESYERLVAGPSATTDDLGLAEALGRVRALQDEVATWCKDQIAQLGKNSDGWPPEVKQLRDSVFYSLHRDLAAIQERCSPADLCGAPVRVVIVGAWTTAKLILEGLLGRPLDLDAPPASLAVRWAAAPSTGPGRVASDAAILRHLALDFSESTPLIVSSAPPDAFVVIQTDDAHFRADAETAIGAGTLDAWADLVKRLSPNARGWGDRGRLDALDARASEPALSVHLARLKVEALGVREFVAKRVAALVREPDGAVAEFEESVRDQMKKFEDYIRDFEKLVLESWRERWGAEVEKAFKEGRKEVENDVRQRAGRVSLSGLLFRPRRLDKDATDRWCDSTLKPLIEAAEREYKAVERAVRIEDERGLSVWTSGVARVAIAMTLQVPIGGVAVGLSLFWAWGWVTITTGWWIFTATETVSTWWLPGGLCLVLASLLVGVILTAWGPKLVRRLITRALERDAARRMQKLQKAAERRLDEFVGKPQNSGSLHETKTRT